MVTVTLRPVEDSDLDQIFGWETDPSAIHQAAFTRPDPSNRATFEWHYARIRNDPAVLVRAVVIEAELVATVGSFTVLGDREVTYWVDPAQQGRGIASAALAALTELEETRPLFARVAEHNAASARVLEKCGFTQIGSERSYANGVGAEITELIYRLE